MTGTADAATDSFSAHQVDRHDRRLDASTTALVVVDMVRDFVEPAGAMPLPDAGRLAEVIDDLAARLRRAGTRVVWVRDEHDDLDDAEFRLRTQHCLAGTGGSDLAAGLRAEPGDRDLLKHRYSAFYGTDLHRWLKESGITTLVVCGVVTNICVRSTVHDAFFHGYDVTVVSDACLATGPREQESTLYDIATHFGRVRSVAEVTAQLVGAVGAGGA
jgi:ureidoacrylate peracid hydrolase